MNIIIIIYSSSIFHPSYSRVLSYTQVLPASQRESSVSPIMCNQGGSEQVTDPPIIVVKDIVESYNVVHDAKQHK